MIFQDSLNGVEQDLHLPHTCIQPSGVSKSLMLQHNPYLLNSNDEIYFQVMQIMLYNTINNNNRAVEMTIMSTLLY